MTLTLKSKQERLGLRSRLNYRSLKKNPSSDYWIALTLVFSAFLGVLFL